MMKFTEPNVELMNFLCDDIIGQPDDMNGNGVGEPSITGDEEI